MKKFRIAMIISIFILIICTVSTFAVTYIEPSDLDFFKEFLKGEGSVTFPKDNKTDIVLVKQANYNDDNTVVFTIREVNKLTDNTYKSILSTLDVIFDSNNVSKYFSEKYSGFNFGNREFNGFKIEINPEFDSIETTVFNAYAIPSYESVRITIDKKQAISEANLIVNNIENEAENNSIDTNKVEHKTNKYILLCGFIILIVIVIISVKVIL